MPKLRTILLLALLLPPAAAAEDSGSGDESRLLPQLDVYFPEGELDFRLNGLIKGAFYEGQIRYDFVDGDILAFLRYRYYGHNRVLQLGLFDSVEFEDLEEGSGEFERVRGGLVLLQWPHTLHRRTFFLAEIDDISSNKDRLRFSSGRTNTFVRLGFQLGTPEDDRSNALVGATRASRRRLFTAHRRIGPRGAGFTGAVSWGFEVLGSDFDYVKAEIESLKRFDLTGGRFLIARLHGGSFLDHVELRDDPTLELGDRLSVPRDELFRLDGRDNLKGLPDERRGTHELHTTGELFLPWFEDEERRGLGVDWHTWYWILYGGYGAIGYERDDLAHAGNYVSDLGIGFEASFRLRDHTFFLSAIVAQALEQEGGPEARLAIKSYR